MTSWPTVRLGDHLRIKHGFAFQGKFFSDKGEYIVLTPGNFIESGGFKSKSGAQKYYSARPPREFMLKRGDLVIAMTEQAQGLLGSSALIPANNTYLHNQRIGLVELRSCDTDQHFLYYLFNTKGVRDQIQASATGSKVRHTAPARVENVIVRLPPLPTQRKIVAILITYDELIENNNRRIKVLEDMAQRIYQEWFVDFRYPGHRGVLLVDSELGPIPEKWTVRRLFDVADITFGFPFKSDLFNFDFGLPVIRIRDIPTGESPTLTTESPADSYRVIDGDILVGMDGEFHMGRWSAGNAWLNQRVTRLRPASNAVCRYGLYLALETPIRDWNRAIVGTTVAHLGKRHLELIKVLTPPSPLATKLALLLDPIFDLEIGLRKAIRQLRTARELLLPRLISGEIDVTDLDIAMPEAAA